jgi:hypothetical protein
LIGANRVQLNLKIVLFLLALSPGYSPRVYSELRRTFSEVRSLWMRKSNKELKATVKGIKYG